MGNFREVGGSRTYKAWKTWEVGNFVAGKFVSQSEDQFGKNNYSVVISDTNIEGLEVGSTLCLNANGSLDYKMESVEKGDEIMVEYLGTKIAEKGAFKGKEFHDIKLMVSESEDQEEDL